MRHGLVSAVALLAGCTPAPTVERDLGTSTHEARIALELAAEHGPVAAEVQGLPMDDAPGRDVEARVLAIMADAVPALGVTFTADASAAAPSPRLVVRHGAPAGAAACGANHGAADDPALVTAAFCEGDLAIGAVSGRATSLDGADRDRLYRRLARRLFPDLYAERYGIGSGPFRFNIGGTFGF